MDEKKGPPRFGGSKVSEIANIFQNRVPNQKEEIFTPVRKTQKLNSGSTEKIDAESPAVTVMRTESHVTRFNNARAMFEKLGSEDHKPSKVIPLQGTKSASNVLDRSRSSSANSETRETKSQSSRSPSPPQHHHHDRFSNIIPTFSENENRKSNGYNNGDSVVIKTNGSDPKLELDRTKPVLMKKPEKPEKPERKFNSKELIERQKNWTSHFSKTRSSRYHSDPNKSEVKLAVNSKESSRSEQAYPKSGPTAARSASFNNAR